MRPHVGAVVADEDGDVADDLDAALRGSRPDRVPLLSKEKLDDAMELQLFCELVMRFLDRIRLACSELARPRIPSRTVEALTKASEEHEVLEPPVVLAAEAFEAIARRTMRVAEKFFCGRMQQWHFAGAHFVIINALDCCRELVQARRLKPSAFSEAVEADEQLVSSEG